MIDATIKILLMITTSFFSAFAVGLNRHTLISISAKKPINKLLLLSEVLVYGLSGFFLGLLATQYTDTIYILMAISGSGGMIGKRLLYAVLKGVIPGLMNLSTENNKK